MNPRFDLNHAEKVKHRYGTILITLGSVSLALKFETLVQLFIGMIAALIISLHWIFWGKITPESERK